MSFPEIEPLDLSKVQVSHQPNIGDLINFELDGNSEWEEIKAVVKQPLQSGKGFEFVYETITNKLIPFSKVKDWQEKNKIEPVIDEQGNLSDDLLTAVNLIYESNLESLKVAVFLLNRRIKLEETKTSSIVG